MANRKFSELSTAEKLLLPFNAASALVDLVFSVPVVGRILNWIWNSILTTIFVLFLPLELLLWKMEVRPMKKMRVGFIVLRDKDGQTLADPDEFPAAIDYIQKAFNQANVTLVPAFPPPKRMSESGDEKEGLKWMRLVPESVQSPLIEPGCNADAILQDIGLPGSRYQVHTLREAFHSSFLRISGYASPLMVFVVNKFISKGNLRFGGCSLGWLTDYVTVKKKSLRTTAHELGHACNLLHPNKKKGKEHTHPHPDEQASEDEVNLMDPKSPGFDDVELKPWQIALLRASRHVTLI